MYVNFFKDGEYYAVLEDMYGENRDFRPCDAVVVALQLGLSIFVKESFLRTKEEIQRESRIFERVNFPSTPNA